MSKKYHTDLSTVSISVKSLGKRTPVLFTCWCCMISPGYLSNPQLFRDDLSVRQMLVHREPVVMTTPSRDKPPRVVPRTLGFLHRFTVIKLVLFKNAVRPDIRPLQLWGKKNSTPRCHLSYGCTTKSNGKDIIVHDSRPFLCHLVSVDTLERK